jgi:hypothetical protein
MFLVALGAFGLFIGAMAVGVIFSNRELKGSCGGLNNITDENGETFCGVCGLPSAESCQNEETRSAS